MVQKQPDIKFAVFSAVVLYPFFFMLFFALLALAWEDNKIRVAFKANGVHTTAKLVGYQSVSLLGRRGRLSRPADVPVLTYVTNQQITYRYLAVEYGAVYDEAAKLLISKKQIDITYLANNPETARVEEWVRNDPRVGLTLSLLACVGLLFAELHSLLVIYNAFKFKSPHALD